MRVLLSLVIFFAICSSASAQFDIYNAASNAMGGTSAAIPSFWSGFNNQAAWADLERPQAGVGYDSRFLLPELGIKYLGAVLPIGEDNGTFGLSILQTGFSKFGITKGGIAYARHFGPALATSMQFDFYNANINDDISGGSRTSFSFELGFQYKINKKLSLGMHTLNPVRTIMSDYHQDAWPVRYTAGFMFKFSDQVMVAGDVVKELEQKPSIRAGMQYMLNDRSGIRMGIVTKPFQAGLGFCFIFGKVLLDVSTCYHQILGISPGLSVSYRY